MAPDLYRNFSEAMKDFLKTEGLERHSMLVNYISQLISKEFLPSIDNLDAAYREHFWKQFGMILTKEDALSYADIAASSGADFNRRFDAGL
jgi:hypothetical protein